MWGGDEKQESGSQRPFFEGLLQTWDSALKDAGSMLQPSSDTSRHRDSPPHTNVGAYPPHRTSVESAHTSPPARPASGATRQAPARQPPASSPPASTPPSSTPPSEPSGARPTSQPWNISTTVASAVAGHSEIGQLASRISEEDKRREAGHIFAAVDKQHAGSVQLEVLLQHLRETRPKDTDTPQFIPGPALRPVSRAEFCTAFCVAADAADVEKPSGILPSLRQEHVAALQEKVTHTSRVLLSTRTAGKLLRASKGSVEDAMAFLARSSRKHAEACNCPLPGLARYATFLNDTWPHAKIKGLTAPDLSREGFRRAPGERHSDRVVCVECMCEMVNLHKLPEPVATLHARSSPLCPLVTEATDDPFVRTLGGERGSSAMSVRSSAHVSVATSVKEGVIGEEDKERWQKSNKQLIQALRKIDQGVMDLLDDMIEEASSVR